MKILGGIILKKNPGRKIKRQQMRDYMVQMKKEATKKVNIKTEKRTPHPNAIKANEERIARIEKVNQIWGNFKAIWTKETKYGKEYLKEQKLRLKRRKNYLKKIS